MYLRKKEIFCKLKLNYKSTTNYVSGIGSVRITISVASHIFDSDNMDFVEIEH